MRCIKSQDFRQISGAYYPCIIRTRGYFTPCPFVKSKVHTHILKYSFTKTGLSFYQKVNMDNERETFFQRHLTLIYSIIISLGGSVATFSASHPLVCFQSDTAIELFSVLMVGSWQLPLAMHHSSDTCLVPARKTIPC